MEWLKAILEKATVTDGKIDVAALMESITKESPKHIVLKADFNNKVEELKTANQTITDLKKDNEDNEELQTKITDYETEISTLKKQSEDATKTYALKEVLREKGCIDPEYLIYKQGGLEKFTFDKEGKPIGVDELTKTYQESAPHIFKTGQQQQQYKPAGGAGGATVNPFAKDTFNLTEQGRLLTENPAQAKEFAAAAGIEL